MDELATHQDTGTQSTNSHIGGLHQQVKESAREAAKATKVYLATREKDPNMALTTRYIMELISTLTAGEVMARATAEATIHPSPTARIHALMSYEAAKKTWHHLMTSGQKKPNPDTHTNLRWATMCMIMKLEGTKTKRWRATTQLMNWVANKIPIMATPAMREIFPALDLKHNLPPYSELVNTATMRQWGIRGMDQLCAAEKEIPTTLRYSQEEWEAGQYCEKKLAAIADHPLGTKICQLNTLFLLCAVADLYNQDTIWLGRRNAQPGAKRAAKTALRHMAMKGTSHYLDTSEVDYDESTLESAINKAFSKDKSRLATLLKETHEATVRGRGQMMDDRFTRKGTKCPDCALVNVESIIILDPTNPAKGVNEHLAGQCGQESGAHKNAKRKASPSGENMHAKRGNNEQYRPTPSTPTRGMPTRGMRGRGRGATFGGTPGRGSPFSNIAMNQQDRNHSRFNTHGHADQSQWQNNISQNNGVNNNRGAGYHTQDYRDHALGNQQNNEPWNNRDGNFRQ